MLVGGASMYRRLRRFRRRDDGAAVVEFALVVPLMFLLVFGALSFARAYQRLNVLTGALREGVRAGAALDGTTIANVQDTARAHMTDYANAFGVSNAFVASVIVSKDANHRITATLSAYPLFADLTGFSVLSGVTVTRSTVFRWERAP